MPLNTNDLKLQKKFIDLISKGFIFTGVAILFTIFLPGEWPIYGMIIVMTLAAFVALIVNIRVRKRLKSERIKLERNRIY